MALEHLFDQSERGNVRKSKQLVSLFFLHSALLFQQVFLCGHYFGAKITVPRGWGPGGGLSKKSGGKEPDCFNLSACGAPLFIKLFGRVIQTQAPVFCAPLLFSHENQFP